MPIEMILEIRFDEKGCAAMCLGNALHFEIHHQNVASLGIHLGKIVPLEIRLENMVSYSALQADLGKIVPLEIHLRAVSSYERGIDQEWKSAPCLQTTFSSEASA